MSSFLHTQLTNFLGSLLDDLDTDLLNELDHVVQENQLARCPFARSGRANTLLHERHPRLMEDINEERQIRVKEMAYKMTQRDEEKKLSSSFKTRFGSLDDSTTGSPTAEKVYRKPKTVRDETFTPVLRPKDSHGDLIFIMDEEDASLAGGLASPTPTKSSGLSGFDIPALSEPRLDSKGKATETPRTPLANSPGSSRPQAMSLQSPNEPVIRKVSDGGNPWGPSNLSTPRLNLREILTESKPAQSALSAGLAAEKKAVAARPVPQKMSQKERKKYMQQQAEQTTHHDTKVQHQPWTNVSENKESPWQQAPSTSKASMKDMPIPDSSLKPPSHNSKLLATVESSANKSIPRRTASPDTRFSGQKTSTTSMDPAKPSRPEPQPLVPHSKSYIKRPPKPEQEIGIALADIIGQQEREQQTVREAVAKRSLQEIQQEQAFQEWWDQESRRMQEEETRRVAREKGRSEKKEGGGSDSGSRRGRGNKSRVNNRDSGAGVAGGNAEASSANAQPLGRRGRARGNRGGKT